MKCPNSTNHLVIVNHSLVSECVCIYRRARKPTVGHLRSLCLQWQTAKHVVSLCVDELARQLTLSELVLSGCTVWPVIPGVVGTGLCLCFFWKRRFSFAISVLSLRSCVPISCGVAGLSWRGAATSATLLPLDCRTRHKSVGSDRLVCDSDRVFLGCLIFSHCNEADEPTGLWRLGPVPVQMCPWSNSSSHSRIHLRWRRCTKSKIGSLTSLLI